MKEPTIEELFSRGTDFLDMYLYPSRLLYDKYVGIHNWKDWNYLLYRKEVKADDQDYLILIKTSQHCYTLSHYRVLDGFNELKKFNKLFDAAQYIVAASGEYDRIYSEVLAERQEEAERRRKERELKKARKQKRDSTENGEL